MTIQSVGEALAVLEETRRELIEKGRDAAHRLIAQNGTATVKDVRNLMRAEGTFDESVRGFWMGAIFTKRLFTWTGTFKSVEDVRRNIHSREVKVWAAKAA